MESATMDLMQQIADKHALGELVALYCRAVDRRDFSLLRRLYHPQAEHDHGELFRGKRNDFITFLVRSMTSVVTHHFVGNAVFALEGDRAEGEVYTINHHVIGQDERHYYVAGGRYLDHYVRHEGNWVIMLRKRVVDWAHEGPFEAAGTASGITHGVAGPGDPSFTLLPGISALRPKRTKAEPAPTEEQAQASRAGEQNPMLLAAYDARHNCVEIVNVAGGAKRFMACPDIDVTREKVLGAEIFGDELRVRVVPKVGISVGTGVFRVAVYPLSMAQAEAPHAGPKASPPAKDPFAARDPRPRR